MKHLNKYLHSIVTKLKEKNKVFLIGIDGLEAAGKATLADNLSLKLKKNLISKILKIKIEKITINSGINNLQLWDSLAHLSILTEIDDFTKGKASKMRGLSNATTVNEILRYDESFLKRIRKIQHYF